LRSTELQFRVYAKRQSLLHALLNDTDLLTQNRIQVRHLMTRQPSTVLPKATVEEMRQVMTAGRVRHLLVCDEDGRLLGVVSNRDFHERCGRTAKELMTRKPHTIHVNSPLGPAITYLVEKHISCLPVVDGDRLCGIITTTDLVLTLQCALQMWLRMAQVMAERGVRVVDTRTDPLTGLSNRIGLDEVLQMVLATKARHQQPSALIAVGIDWLGADDVTAGSPASDRAIRALVQLIIGCVRETDFIARYEDDALAIVLPYTNLEGAFTAGERVRRVVEEKLAAAGGLRISLGAASALDNEPPAAFLGRAETALAAARTAADRSIWCHDGTEVQTADSAALAAVS
jgi:diguanylate cyclase (GGDEF)-like protein